jgi:hypothetical protein
MGLTPRWGYTRPTATRNGARGCGGSPPAALAEAPALPRLFNIKLLTAHYQETAHSAAPNSLVVPFTPLLAQGWALLTPDNLVCQPLHERLRAHLLPALWTTYTAQGVALVRTLIQPHETTRPEAAGQDPAQLKHPGCDRDYVQLPADTAVEFTYYGDLLADLVAQVGTPLGQEPRIKGLVPIPNVALQGEILAEIATRAGVTESDIRLEVGDLPIQKDPANWDWVQAIIRALDHIPGLNSQLIDAFMRDVYVYLTYPGVRARIDKVVADALSNEPCVVVAHSLGTVVAYNVLCGRAPAPQYPKLMTVGSPLGIQTIKQQLATSLVSPPCVEHWFNAYDDRDVVALVPLDDRTFNAIPPIANRSDRLNFTDNRHGIEGYLADPVVAQQIVKWL